MSIQLTMWGRMESCGRLETGLSTCLHAHRRPIANRPQDSILPHF